MNGNRLHAFAVASIWLIAFSSTLPAQQADEPFVGSWNAELDSPGGSLRFGLSITSGDDSIVAFLHNGPERIKIPKSYVDEAGALVLDIRHYDSKLRFRLDDQDNSMEGEWQKRRGVDEWVNMKVRATRSSRTPKSSKREFGIFPGKWKVRFEKSVDPAVAIFKADQSTGHLIGTFLTTTGDYRYLDGQILDGRLELSCFDGAHAFLFHAQAQPDGSLKGDFWSSNTWHESWTAARDEDAALPDAFTQTSPTGDSDWGRLSFPDLDGKPTRLDDPKFLADARIIYIFGSWCPNCHDAGKYFGELKSWYGDKLSIVGLAFELTGDLDRDGKQVREYLKRHGCDYPVLIAGLADKALASKAIPCLDRVRSYPTTIFLDRDGKVKAIHTGFAGPATGDAFVQQKKKFESIIDATILEAGK